VVKVPHIGMVNLVAEKEVCPECIQHAATPGVMATAVDPLLSASPERQAMLEGLKTVRSRLLPDRDGDAVVEALEALG
jgi:lipid-A-disaccharide synthase